MKEAAIMTEERCEMLTRRCEALTKAMIEVDYLISYGKICEARTAIEGLINDQQLNRQKGILNGKAKI